MGECSPPLTSLWTRRGRWGRHRTPPTDGSSTAQLRVAPKLLPAPLLHWWSLPVEMIDARTELMGEQEESRIINFYRDKHILLTGATGFLGKLVIEKLLRICKPKMIYVLIRNKKSNDPQKRIQEMMQNMVFDRLKKEVPDYMSHISVVSGDVSVPGLDLLPSDRDVLIEKIQVVLHGAATVKFDEKLDLAIKINILGTKSILELCSKMKNLQSVVHVSTAFSNCIHPYIKEEFYEPPLSADSLIKLSECLKNEQLDMITPYIIDPWPNTYAFTKAIAEEAVSTYGKGLPVAIFRPAIIIASKSQPYPGWSDNLYGPQGLSVGAAVGLIRVVRFDENCKTDLVPADFAVNCLLAIGQNTATMESHQNIPIYNFCTDPRNTITWGDYMRICLEKEKDFPLSNGIWYCSVTSVRSWAAFLILTFLLHTLPALLIDIVLIVVKKKPRALDIYKKIHKMEILLSYFSTSSWNFSLDNTINLWQNLPSKDKELFEFDMATLDFKSYLTTFVKGIRLYLCKDDTSTIPRARRRTLVLFMIHRLFQLAFFSSCGWCVWRLSSLILG